MKSLFLILVMTLAGLTVANADVYKWVDENGNVHFTDTPPPKQQTEELKVLSAPTPSPQRAGSTAEGPSEHQEGITDGPSDREICSAAIRNLRKYAPIWERKVRAKMPQMAVEERESAEQALVQMKSNMRKLKSSLGECVRDMEKSTHRTKTECMANAPDDTTAMVCVM